MVVSFECGGVVDVYFGENRVGVAGAFLVLRQAESLGPATFYFW